MFIDLALSAAADALVTGDGDLLVLAYTPPVSGHFGPFHSDASFMSRRRIKPFRQRSQL
jgi:hypothetical protein